MLHASAVILAHNHPSGKVAPSADVTLTRVLKEGLVLVNVQLLDHFVLPNARDRCAGPQPHGRTASRGGPDRCDGARINSTAPPTRAAKIGSTTR